MTDTKTPEPTGEDKRLLDEVRPLMGPPPGELPPQSESPIDQEVSPEIVAPLPDDTTTSEAVEDIVSKESSQLIEAEDEKLAKAFTDKPPKKTFMTFVRAWWSNRVARRATLIGLVVLLVTILAVPTTRYFVLNNAGVRVSAKFTVLDDKTDKPIRNVEVALDAISAKTDEQGQVTLTGLSQGKHSLVIKKRSFSPISEGVILGWGSNPFTPYKLTPTGSQYGFQLNDWLSGQPVVVAEVSESDSTAFSDDKGLATLTVDSADSTELSITVKAKNYRTETVKISAGRKEPLSLKLVAEQPDFFMSKRTGIYDVYKIDADAKNEELLLAGTGKERDDIVLSPSLDKKYLGLVSTRKGTINSDGYVMQNLSVIEVSTKKLSEISESEQIRIVGWVDSSIVYVKVISGASGANPNRQKLIAYDVTTGNLQDLANSNNFNDVTLSGGRVYYAPSNVYGDDPNASFVSIKTDGSDRQTHLDRQTWSILRTSHDSYSLSTIGNKWYSYKLGDAKAVSAATPTSTPRDRQYADNPDNSRSAWVDYRDGKGVILLWDKKTNEEKVLYSKGGLNNPLQWLSNDHLVYRIATSQETADYVINVYGGDPQKISDVVNVNSYGGSGYYN